MPGSVRMLFSRLRAWFGGRSAMLAEFDDELAAHIDLLAQQYEAAGMPREEAVPQARLRVGSPALLKEDHYEHAGIAFLDTLAQDLRYAVRMLRKSPATSAAIILTLALGIGVNTAVFTLVDALLLRSLPYRDPDRLVLLGHLPVLEYVESPGKFSDWKLKSTLLEGASLYATTQVNLAGPFEPVHVALAQVSANLPDLLGGAPVLGRTFVAGEDLPGKAQVALISSRLWLRQFHGDRSVLSTPLSINGSKFTIIGVLPPRFDYPAGTDVWTPTIHSMETLTRLGATMTYGIGRMKPDVSVAQVIAQEKSIIRLPDVPAPEGFESGPLAQPLQKQLSAGEGTPALFLLGTAALVLLIACANIASLVLVRSVAREREFSLRRALGVSRARLLRQILTEQCLTGVLGGAAGVVVAYLSLPWLQRLLPAEWPSYAEPAISIRVLAFALAASLGAGFLTSFAPWNRACRRSPRAVDRSGFRNVLAAGQVCLVMVLLAATSLLVQSFLGVTAIDQGFQPGEVLAVTVSRPDARNESGPAMTFYRETAERLRALAGVRCVSAVDNLPNRTHAIALWEGSSTAPERHGRFTPKIIMPEYFRAMEIRLLAGRDFTEQDRTASSSVVIINDLLARSLWPAGDALGRELHAFDKPFRIVGIVHAARIFSPQSEPMGEVYFPYGQRTPDTFTFLLRTDGRALSYAAAARNVIRGADPHQPIDEISTTRLYWEGTLSHERCLATLAGLFTLLGVALSLTGVYGLVAYTVSARAKEFGIRLALGARPRQLISDAVRRTTLWILAGAMAGTALAFLVRRAIHSVLYEGTQPHPELLVALACGLIAISAIAAFAAAARNAVLDPARTLRHE